ncbi:MAG TPA: S-adenosylmethionine:tRNA ribosyltransferase-isomerase [Gaiellales bacterium]|nr:S-adenosylmethionine:tRNA ribosyltransferase-isomerase [Gaiellales bacterium]
MSTAALQAFDLGPELEAASPPEERGIARDGVRMMVAHRLAGSIEHSRFDRIAEHLAADDAIVVNVSRTLPAAVTAVSPRGEELVLHFSSPYPADERLWVVEPRLPAGAGTAPFLGLRAGDRLALPGGASVDVREPYLGERLWVARPRLVGTVESYLGRRGRPIRYAYAAGEWSLGEYQTIFGTEPGSSEMPSAGRPFTVRTLAALAARGVRVVPIVLHCGVSSLENGESPLPERFAVSAAAASRLNGVRGAGGRVVAIGTTVVRALESAADAGGHVHETAGWTDLVIGPDRPVTAVDGLLTGWHEPGASHLDMIEAIAGRSLAARSYAAAVAGRYLWHEFGDVHLILP